MMRAFGKFLQTVLFINTFVQIQPVTPVLSTPSQGNNSESINVSLETIRICLEESDADKNHLSMPFFNPDTKQVSYFKNSNQ